MESSRNPSCRWRSSPHAKAEPSSSTATLCPCPQAAPTTRAPAGSATLAASSAASFSTQPPLSPTLSLVPPSWLPSLPMAMPSWPRSFAPKAKSAPSLAVTRTCDSLAATAVAETAARAPPRRTGDGGAGVPDDAAVEHALVGAASGTAMLDQWRSAPLEVTAYNPFPEQARLVYRPRASPSHRLGAAASLMGSRSSTVHAHSSPASSSAAP
mmetsp:Transcript_16533/g.52818  ORF Transcript_16533/g.52818 Transcript_16533/m.52818 type:complete len:212 (+) Transcript_16533:197-832(+)